jgi:hypothetical protein
MAQISDRLRNKSPVTEPLRRLARVDTVGTFLQKTGLGGKNPP